MSCFAVVLAAGKGERFRGAKQRTELEGKPLLLYSLEAFQNHPRIDGIVLVVPEKELDAYRLFAERLDRIKAVVAGGSTRQESSRAGVYAAREAELLLIHDAARPFVSQRLIDRLLEALQEAEGAVPVLPPSDSLAEVEEGYIMKFLPRERALRVQTPQAFRREIISKAHRLAEEEGLNKAPDDSSLILRYGLGRIRAVEGEVWNIKITYPEDLQLAQAIARFGRWR